MTKINEPVTIETILTKVKTYITDKEKIQKIIKAYNLANEKHEGQFRKSGEPYILHPLNVAYILTDIKADTDTLCAALLHDTIEDTDIKLEDLEKEVERLKQEIANYEFILSSHEHVLNKVVDELLDCRSRSELRETIQSAEKMSRFFKRLKKTSYYMKV